MAHHDADREDRALAEPYRGAVLWKCIPKMRGLWPVPGHSGITVASPHGDAVLRVVVTSRQRKGSVFAPIHWTNAQAGNARVDALIAGAVDPVSGQPELKAAPVAVSSFPATWFAFAVSVTTPGCPTLTTGPWRVLRHGWRLEFGRP